MLSTVARTIATHRLLAPGDRVVVAVSGGPDSMALLHALWELRERLKIELVVAGVDHGLRPEAAGELGLVAERAAALGLPFAKLTADVPGVRARRRGASLQDAARDARLHVLAAFAAERGGLAPEALQLLEQQLVARQKKLKRRAKSEFDRLFSETQDAFAGRLSAYLKRPMEKPALAAKTQSTA